MLVLSASPSDVVVPLAIVGVGLVVLGWAFSGVVRQALRNRWLLRHGEAAEGTVAELRPTPVTINGHPVLELVMEVRRSGEHPYFASARRVVPESDAWRVAPGTAHRVRVDPRAPHLIAVAEPLSGGPPPGRRRRGRRGRA